MNARNAFLATAVALLLAAPGAAQTLNLSTDTPAESFVGEQFCFTATLTNTGDPGYGPYIRLIVPEGMTFDSATHLGAGVTVVDVGMFPVGGELTDPYTGTDVSGPEGAHLYLLQPAIGSVTEDFPPIDIEVCLTIATDAAVGVPLDVVTQPVYRYGDTATGANGPIEGTVTTDPVTPTVILFTKSNDAPVDPGSEDAAGPSFPVTFTLSADIANAQTVTNLVFNDTLPADFQYTAGSVAVTGGAGYTVNQEPPVAGPGGTLQVTVTSATGAIGGGDVTVNYTGYVTDILDHDSCDTAVLTNDATLDATYDGSALGQSSADASFTAKHLALQKGAGASPARPDGTVTYTVSFQVSDYIDADDLVLTDTLPDGVTWVGVSSLTVGGTDYTAELTPTVTHDGATGVTTVVSDVSAAVGAQLAGGTAGTLVYSATIDQTYEATGEPVHAADGLPNTIIGDYDIVGAASPDCSDDAAASVTIDAVAIQKDLVNPQPEYEPGDVVTFRLRMDIPSGDTLAIAFEDFLPLPVFDATTVSTTWSADVTFGPNNTLPSTIPTITTDAATNSVRLEFPDVSSTTSEVLEIDLDVVVQDEPFADGLDLINLFRASTNNTPGDTTTGLTPTPIRVRAPDLVLTKGVLSSSNPDATIDPDPAVLPVDGDIADVDAGDTVTYLLTAENTGGAPAFDVTLTDTVPAGLTGCSVVSVTLGDGTVLAPGTDYSGDLFGAGLVLSNDIQGPSAGALASNDDIPDGGGPPFGGDTVIVEVACTVADTAVPGDTLTNTGSVTWASQPGADTFPATTDDAQTAIAVPALAKSFVQTEIDTADNSATEAAVAELVTYQLQVAIPEGVTPGVQIVDTLDAGLAFVDVLSVAPSAGVTLENTIGTGTTPTGVTIGAGGQTVTFDPGDITNTDRDNATPELLTITYRAVVLNVAGNQAGTPLDNLAGLTWTGGSTPTVSAAAVTVVEPALSVSKTLSPDSGDAGDVIGVTLSITSGAGGNDTGAYDVTLTDAIPAGMTYDGGGVTCTPAVGTPNPDVCGESGGTVTVQWTSNPVPAGGSCDVTFNVTLDQTVEPTDTLTNTADLDWTSYPGGPGQRSVHNTASVERDGSGGINDYADSASDTLTIDNVVPVKTVAATSEDHTAGTDVAVGEIVRYRFEIALPEGTSTNLQLRDLLPADLEYLDDGTTMLALLSDTPIVSQDPPGALALGLGGGPMGTPPWVLGSNPTGITPTFVLPDQNVGSTDSLDTDTDSYGSGDDPFLKLGTLVNQDSDVDTEYIIVELNALVLNTTDIDDGSTRNDRVRVTVEGGTLATSAGVNVTVREPGSDLTKTISPATGDAGDTASYQVSYTNSGSTTAFDLQLTDVLPADLILTLASVNVTLNGGASGLTDTSAGNTVDVTIDEIPAGDGFDLTYDAVVVDDVPPSTVISNDAEIEYTSLPGANGTTGNATGSDTPGAPGADDGERDGSDGDLEPDDYFDEATAPLTIASPGLVKTVESTSLATTGSEAGTDLNDAGLEDLAVGETVTFYLTATLPEGETPSVLITDTLPVAPGLLNVVSTQTISVGNDLYTDTGMTTQPTAAITITDSRPSGGDGYDDEVQFDFGNVYNDPDGDVDADDTIVVEVVARVANVPANADDVDLTNASTLNFGLGLVQATDVTVEVVEPEIEVDKTASPTSGDAGDTITFTIDVQHASSSTADGYDLQLTDTIPAGMTYATGTLDCSGGTLPADFCTHSGGLVTAEWDHFPLGETTTITFDVTLDPTVSPGETLTNTADLGWDSLPDDGVDFDRDDTDSDTAGVVITQPGLTKAVADVAADTSVAETGTAVNGPETDLTIGETVTYTVTITVPEGQTEDAILTDTLPTLSTPQGVLEAVSASVASVGANLTLGNDPAVVTLSDGADADTLDDTVTVDFGTIDNAEDGVVDDDDRIQVRITARVADVPTNQGGIDDLINTASYTWTGAAAPVQATEAVDIVEPLLQLTKTNLDPYGDAGDTITYEVTVSHTGASTADAFDIVLTDTLPAGQTYVGLVSTGDPLPTADASTPPLVVFGYDTVPLAAGSYTFRYQVTLDASVEAGETYTNQIDGSWDSLPTAGDPGERVGTDTVTADVTINAPVMVKVASVTSLADTGQGYHVGADFDLAIGELVTYTLDATFPEGTTSSALVTDQVQADGDGVLEIVDARILSTGGNISTTQSTISPDPIPDGTTAVTFDFGTVTNTPDGVIDADDRITLEVVARVVDVVANADADSLLNLASLTFQNGSDDDDATVDVVEPALDIDKTMSNPVNGVVTMTVQVENTGTAPAYDIEVVDLLPAATWATTTVAPVSIPTGFAFAATGAPGDATVTIASDGGSAPPDSSIEPGETVTFAFSAALVQPPATSPVTNTATNTEASTLPGDDPEERDEPDVEDTAQLPLPILDVTKTAGFAPGGDTDASGTVSPGDVLRYTLTITNSGTGTANTLNVSDPVADPNLALVVGTVVAPTGFVIIGNNPGDTAVAALIPTLPPGSTTVTYDALIADPVASGVDSVANQAVVDSAEQPEEPSDDPGTPDDDDPTVVPLDAAPDIAVTKDDGVTEARPGDTLTYQITVENVGYQDATGVDITDTIPTGTTFVSATDGGTHAAGVVSWPAIGLAAGASVTRSVTVTVDDPAPVGQGSVVNTASAADDGANGPDPDPSNNSDDDTDTLIHADLSVAKTDSPDPVLAGEQLTYTLTVTNNGPAADPDVVVTDTLPTELVFVSATPSQGSCSEAAGVVTCTLGALANGGTATIDIVGDVPSGTPAGTLTNTASVTGEESDPDPTNNDDSEDTDVAEESDLAIVKTDSPDPVTAGETLTWTLQVTNNGPSDATSVTVTDDLPAGTTFASASAGCSESGGTVTCTAADLADGDAISFDIVVTVDTGTTGTIGNTAAVDADQDDPDPANDDDSEDTDVDTLADVLVTKTGPGSVNRGETLTFAVAVANDGPSDAVNVVVTDPTPDGLVFDAASAPCAGGFPCSIGTLAAGAQLDLTVSYQVPPDYAGPDPIVNTVSAGSDTSDSDPDNNDDSSSTAVDHAAEADLAVVKTGPPSAAAGSTVTYQLTVTNNGPNDAGDVVLDDPDPAGLTFNSAGTPCGGGFPCTLGTVNAGASVTVGVTFDIPAGYAEPEIVNVVTVTTSTDDSDPANDTDDETTPIGDDPVDLYVVKTGPATADPGDTITYTITVGNNGPADATGVTVTDALPAGLTYAGDGCGGDLADGTWSVGALHAGTAVECQLTVDVDAGASGTVINTAAATGNETDADPTNNDDDAPTGIGADAADVGVVKTGPARAYPGGTVAFTMVVTNHGPGTAVNVQLDDPTPTGLGFDSASDPCSAGFPCTVGDLAPGSSVTVGVTFTVPTDYAGPDPIVNTATVDTDSEDPDPTNDTDDAETDYVPEADLSITKDDGQTTVVPGTALTYTIVVANAGPGDVIAGTVTDTFPAALTGVSWTCVASAGSSCSASGAGDISDTVNLLPGGTLTYTVGATIDPAATGTLINTAAVNLPPGMTDPDPSDNSDDDVDTLVPETDLSVTKTDSVDPVTEGDDLTYTIEVTNNGPSNATGVTVTDDLPDGVGYVSASAGCSAVGSIVTCTVGALAAGESASLEITVTVDYHEPGPLTNVVSVTGNQDDPDGANDSDDETTDVLYTELDALKTVSPPADGVAYRPDEIVTWTVTVTNTGNLDATGVTLTDQLDPVLAYQGGTLTLDGGALTDAVDGDAGSYDGGTTTLTVVLDPIPAGGSQTVTFDTRLSGPTGNPPYDVENQAVIDEPGGTFDSDDPNTDPDDDPTGITIESRASIPVTGPFGTLLLILLTAAAGAFVLRRTS